MKSSIALLLTLTLAAPLAAQRLADTRLGVATADTVVAFDVTSPAPAAPAARLVVPQEPSTTRMVVTGTLFMAGGMFAGAVLGRDLERCGPDTEFCGFGGAVLGALAGEMFGLPLGVHVASDHSTLAAKTKASVLVFLAGVVTAPLNGGLSIAAIPPVQLIATIAVEKKAARKARERAMGSP